MSPGGAILLDDWQGPYSGGATRAIQEFSALIDHEEGELILFPRKAIFYRYDKDAHHWGSAIEKVQLFLGTFQNQLNQATVRLSTLRC